MNEIEGHDEQGGVSVRVMEIVVAGAIMGLAALVMYDNWLIGAGWAPDGPQAGYFPFYIGLLMFVSSSVVLLRALASRVARVPFVVPHQFKQVMTLLAPTAIYIAVTAVLGIYVASALYLAFFMAVLGRYRAIVIVPVAIGVPVVLFLLFEVWFLVPLPKGPLETWLGY
jgi:putative tricarboxylic transport membrane protein